MTKQEALNILDQATANLQMPRKAHLQVMEALQELSLAPPPCPKCTGTENGTDARIEKCKK